MTLNLMATTKILNADEIKDEDEEPVNETENEEAMIE